MNREKIAFAMQEAKRFLSACEKLPEPEPYDCHGMTIKHDNFPKEQGAIKRASMDLTRALADLRRPS